ncbi:MAG: SH3 domain-containing protein [Chamaesiphon sp.]|nr:SH3 domain-containing protein [Chamaesiphon sp.]
MNNILGKLLVLVLGVNLGVMTIEATSPRAAIAQQLCQSYKVTRNGGLYVYINAGSRIITTLPYGQLVSVTGISAEGDWARIEYLRMDGQIGEGWVAADHLACYQE